MPFTEKEKLGTAWHRDMALHLFCAAFRNVTNGKFESARDCLRVGEDFLDEGLRTLKWVGL